jgi:kinesin family protein C2/C3
VNQYASLEGEFKDLKEKFSEEAKERKDLYNKLIELKGYMFILLSVYTLLLQDMVAIGLTVTCILLR